MNFTFGGSTSNPTLYLYFKIADARVAALDTPVTITFDDGSGHSGTAWSYGLVAEDHTTIPLIFALPAATVLSTLVVKASYTAAVVAAPQSALGMQIDAIGLQATTTL